MDDKRLIMNQTSHATENPAVVIDAVLPQWGPVWLRALAAFAVGGTILQTGLAILDVHLKWFFGLDTFNGS